MKLDRNINKDGKGKYALVRLREIDPNSEAEDLLRRPRDSERQVPRRILAGHQCS